MAGKRARWLLVVVAAALVCITAGHPVPKKSLTHVKPEVARKSLTHIKPEVARDESAHTKSYIDIDASDPFKVPKSSQYIDQPVPEFSRGAKEKEEQEEAEDKAPPSKSIDNIQDDLKHLGLENVGKENSEQHDSKPEVPEDSPAASEGTPDEGSRLEHGAEDESASSQEGQDSAQGLNKPVEVDMSNNIDPSSLKGGDTRHNVPEGIDEAPLGGDASEQDN